MSAGRHLPDATSKIRDRGPSLGGDNPFRWRDDSTQDLCGNRKVVLSALPGAFTPTCSASRMPRSKEFHDEFLQAGADEVISLTGNDEVVVRQWGKTLGAGKVFQLPDSNGGFTRKSGMPTDMSNQGFGMCPWRYALAANHSNHGVTGKMFVEPDHSDNGSTDPFEVSDAETVRSHRTAGQS